MIDDKILLWKTDFNTWLFIPIFSDFSEFVLEKSNWRCWIDNLIGFIINISNIVELTIRYYFYAYRLLLSLTCFFYALRFIFKSSSL